MEVMEQLPQSACEVGSALLAKASLDHSHAGEAHQCKLEGLAGSRLKAVSQLG